MFKGIHTISGRLEIDVIRTNLQDTSFCPRSFTRGNRDVHRTILRGCNAVGVAR